ncbi:transcription factor E2F5-like isoform X2 [Anabas testudineus]|nr:transcription factor E2F5-like isoform X2 [Anabas testudineus]XP_026233930.1 transcription factor E2F5-like isoform X2 [Anabas testudineus]
MDPEVSPHSPDEETVLPDQIPKYQRSMRSLNLLATRFVKLLQEAEDGVLDLKEAVRVLAVGQKRRIYDITNVLEGVGLLVTISKSVVKWTGTALGENAHELTKRLKDLKSELEHLEQMEFMLDQQKLWVEQSIRNINEDCSNLTYVNHEDICSCFSGQTLLAVRAPSGTQLDVPIPKAVQDSPVKYQVHLKSISGPIDVVLLSKRSVSSDPVVLPVPPPDEMLQNAKLAMSASDETENGSAQCPASADATNNAKSRQTSTEGMQPIHPMPCLKMEPYRAGASKFPDLSKELKTLLDSPKEIMNANLITKMMASNVFFSTSPSVTTFVET